MRRPGFLSSMKGRSALYTTTDEIIKDMLKEAGTGSLLEYIRRKITEAGNRFPEDDDENTIDIIHAVLQTVCEEPENDEPVKKILEMIDYISDPRRYYIADALFALNTYLNYGYTAEDAKKIVKDIQKTVIGFIEEAERREKEMDGE